MILPATDRCEITREKDRVRVFRNKELLLDMPWEAAIEVGRALVALGRQAEQNSKIEQVIEDQAVLLRAGAPVCLTYAGYEEAIKMAQWDSRLRRYMPNKMGNIESEEVLGLPTLTWSK